MNLRNLILIPALLAAAPAAATGGFTCRGVESAPVRISIITGTGEGGIALVTVREGRRLLSTGATGDPVVVGESRLDDDAILIDLLDPEDRVRMARIEARRGGGATDLSGTLNLGGQVYRILCRPEQ